MGVVVVGVLPGTGVPGGPGTVGTPGRGSWPRSAPCWPGPAVAPSSSPGPHRRHPPARPDSGRERERETWVMSVYCRLQTAVSAVFVRLYVCTVGRSCHVYKVSRQTDTHSKAVRQTDFEICLGDEAKLNVRC